MTPRIQ
ncbi:Protein CBG26947 [Caenorhabditis briggsae]|nr:Protein CBG26947 [Caenorhabditis briggsae]CAR99470.1 Protein CBG26947 [Caenorhabditis briggsae]